MRAVRVSTLPEENAPPSAAPSSPSSRRRSSRAMRAASVTPPPPPITVEPPVEPSPPIVARPAPAPRPRPAANAAPADPSLSDARLRQIYAQYVEAKRAAKESTAGVTYEGLAQQLRTQAEKLKASHPHKSVDYSVVMKDGKPTLKPILR
jgi:hypothetical protein